MTHTLLLIDDDEISRELIAALLAPLGVESVLAESGEAALEHFRNGSVPPSGVLLDAQLPGIRGVALIAALRSLTSAPILLMSASDVAAELRSAADVFLLKPVEPEQILAALPSLATGGAAHPPAPPATRSEANLIEPAMLEKLRSRMKPAALRAVYQALADDLAQRLPALDLALRAADYDQVSAIAHAIKGGCAMLGVRTARDAATSLEISPSGEDAQRNFAALHTALDALRAAIASNII
jgi:CheY-like chemotaxis protein/HPt (histidine-containing phosphotransfer) domain-containing protein